MTQAKWKWACPMCGMDHTGKHKRTLKKPCGAHRIVSGCGGFTCQCEEDTKRGHGDSQQNPCPEAFCDHCGWSGRFPPAPKQLQPWEKKALEAGWTPPPDWGGPAA